MIDGTLLKEARLKSGLSVRELAEKVEVSKSYIAAIENNQKENVSPSILARIKEYLNIQDINTTIDYKFTRVKAMIATNLFTSEEINIMLDELEKQIVTTPTKNPSPYLPEIYLAKSQYNFNHNNNIQGYSNVDHAWSLLRKSSNVFTEHMARYLLALKDFQNYNYHSALERLLTIDDEVNKFSTPHIFLGILNVQIAQVYQKMNRLEKALLYMSKSIENFEQIPFLVIEFKKVSAHIVRLYEFATQLEEKQSYQDALKFYTKAIEYGEIVRNFTESLRSRCNLAELYDKYGHTEKALEVVNRVIEVCIKSNATDLDIYFHALDILSEIHVYYHEYDQALECVNEIIDNSGKFPYLLARGYKTLATIILRKDDSFTEYERNMKKAINILQTEYTEHKLYRTEINELIHQVIIKRNAYKDRS